MYFLAVIAQAFGCALLASGGASALEFALVPILVAVNAATGRIRYATGLIGATLAGVALTVLLAYTHDAVLVRVHWAVLPYYGGVAALGLILGAGIRRRWAFGTIVAAMMAPACVGIVVTLLVAWDWWLAEAATWFLYLEQTLGEPASAEQRRIIERLEWMFLEHWGDMGLGIAFGLVLIMTCIGVSVTSRWAQNRDGLLGPRGAFRTMRPPDILVWGVIAVAALWYADQQWPGIGLRPVVWNTALALAAVYWTNGAAVLAYALHLLRPPTVVAAVGFVAVITLAGLQSLCIVGLFDTWFSFRTKLRAWKVSRQLARAARRNDG